MTPAGKAHILDLIWDDAGLLVSLDLTGTRCGDTCRWYDDDNTTRATFRSDIMRPWGKQHFNIISFLFWLVILLCSFTVPLVCWNLSFSWPVGVSLLLTTLHLHHGGTMSSPFLKSYGIFSLPTTVCVKPTTATHAHQFSSIRALSLHLPHCKWL